MQTIEVDARQAQILCDILDERVEDIVDDMAHYAAHPEELVTASPPGEDPLTLGDYEHYLGEVKALLGALRPLSEVGE